MTNNYETQDRQKVFQVLLMYNMHRQFSLKYLDTNVGIIDSKIWYFWNFPFNIFRPQLSIGNSKCRNGKDFLLHKVIMETINTSKESVIKTNWMSHLTEAIF